MSTVGDFAKRGGEMRLTCDACSRDETLTAAELLDRYGADADLKDVKVKCEAGRKKGCASLAIPILPRS